MYSCYHKNVSIIAKFNCSVPGTLPTNSSECAQIATNSKDLTTLSPTSSTSVVYDLTSLITNSSTLPPTSYFDISNFESNSITDIILVIVPIVGGVTILSISILTVCVIIWFRSSRKRQLNSISSDTVVAQPQNTGIIFLWCSIY